MTDTITNLYIGKATLALPVKYVESWSVDNDGGTIKAAIKATSLEQASRTRDALVAYVDNKDEPVVPVWVSSDDSLNGWFTIESVSVEQGPASLNTLWWPVTIQMKKYGLGWSSPNIDIITLGSLRKNSYSITAKTSWVGFDGNADGVGIGVNMDLETFPAAEGSVKIMSGNSNYLLGSGNKPRAFPLEIPVENSYTNRPKIIQGVDRPEVDTLQELYHPGSTGKKWSIGPAAAQVSGDIQVGWYGVLPDLTPAANVYFVAQIDQYTRMTFMLDPSSYLHLQWANSSGTVLDMACLSTLSSVASAGKRIAVCVTLDLDNGSGGYTARFYYSLDMYNWTALGSAVTVGGGTTDMKTTASTLHAGDDAGWGFGKYEAGTTTLRAWMNQSSATLQLNATGPADFGLSTCTYDVNFSDASQIESGATTGTARRGGAITLTGSGLVVTDGVQNYLDENQYVIVGRHLQPGYVMLDNGLVRVGLGKDHTVTINESTDPIIPASKAEAFIIGLWTGYHWSYRHFTITGVGRFVKASILRNRREIVTVRYTFISANSQNRETIDVTLRTGQMYAMFSHKSTQAINHGIFPYYEDNSGTTSQMVDAGGTYKELYMSGTDVQNDKWFIFSPQTHTNYVNITPTPAPPYYKPIMSMASSTEKSYRFMIGAAHPTPGTLGQRTEQIKMYMAAMQAIERVTAR